MRKTNLIISTLALGLLTASATILPYSWQRFDVYQQPGVDGTGQNHPIRSGFATSSGAEPPNNSLPIVDNVCVGGPLGPEGLYSRNSLRTRQTQASTQGSFFEEPVPLNTATLTNSSPWGNFFQTNDNWVVECWVLPTVSAARAGSYIGPVFATGINRNNRSSGRQSGVVVSCVNSNRQTGLQDFDGNVWLRCQALAGGKVETNGLPFDYIIGPDILIKTPTNAAWMHVAVVRDTVAGTVAWYTNGVMVASTNIYRVWNTNYFSSPGFGGIQDSSSAGNPGLPSAANSLNAYMAELRWSSFPPGEFSVTNLLTRRVTPGSPTVWYGPSIVRDPVNRTVWAGGAAPFTVVAATDTSLKYQWFRGASLIAGATNNTYVLENTSIGADNGAQFKCKLTDSSSLSITSAVVTLSVVANSPSIANGYSNAVMAEASLIGYLPVDGSTGSTINNVKDPAHNATVYNAPVGAFFNGNTNLVAGKQGLSLNTPNVGYTGGYGLSTNQFGYAEIVGADFSFSTGNGTVEAVLSMEPSAKTIPSADLPCWLSSATIPGVFDYYQFKADINGNLFYQNSTQTAPLIWIVPGGFIGKRVHVAIVFENTTNVTAYANGVNLGTKVQSNFGNTLADQFQPLTIGKRGGEFGDAAGYIPNLWRGSIDEVAIYGSALSANTIASHYYLLQNGSTPAPASIAKISPSKNLYVGFPSQTLSVTPGGTPPYTFQWRLNTVAISGETNAILPVSSLGLGTYNYSVIVQGAVGGAVTSAPVVLTVVNPSGYAAKVFSSSGGSPKAFYPLGETSGTTIFDWAGTHDGEVSGAYSLADSGPAGGTSSIKMFGTNVLDPITQITTPSQVQVPFYTELNPVSGTFTHEFWYRPDSGTRTVGCVSSAYTVGNNRAGPVVMMGFGTVAFGNGANNAAITNFNYNIGKYNDANGGVGAQLGANNTVTVPQVGQWYHVAAVADANNGVETVYVNGSPESVVNVAYSLHPGDGSVTPGWNQNYYAPLILGNRNLGGYPMEGSLSQVAVYDYALSYDDITNHTSLVWSPASFTLQPAAVTNVESISTPVTLTAAALGVPNTYQWVKDGIDLVQSQNLDGTTHYPRIGTVAADSQGIFSPKLVISQSKTNDSGLYTLRVNNPGNVGGFTNSVSVYVKITNDTVLPTITNVFISGTTISGPVLDATWGTAGTETPASLFLIEARFAKRMDPSSVTNPANYVLSGGVTVTNVILATSIDDTKFGADYRTVGLVTSGMTPGTSYTLTVNNVYDEASFSNKLATAIFNIKAPVLRTNSAVWNYYYKVNGGFNALATRTNTAFPFVPQVSISLTNFSSEGVAYGGSLKFNSVFTGESDNYVSSMSALVTPTNTGYYEFFIAGDDDARLYMNPNGSDPAGATFIGSFHSTLGAQNFSFAAAAIATHYPLTNGQSYFVTALHQQNNTSVTQPGDQLRVGWRYLGTVDQPYDGTGANGAWIVAANSLPPIEGKFLSSYTIAPPVIGVQPHDVVAAVGTVTNLFVTVASTGTGVTNYQWQLNGTNSAGRTAATNSFSPLAFANYGTWTVSVDDGSGVSPTVSTPVTVRPPAFTITTPPGSKAVPQGVLTTNTVGAATFSGVTNYQWLFNSANLTVSANIAGPTARTMTINSMRPENVGPYKVIVSDGFNSATSTVANLTIAANPVMTNGVSGTNITMKFPTELGPQYILEFKNQLTDPSWTVLSTNNGTGGALTLSNSLVSPAQRFFRLRMQ